jgi:hypothetical protein
VAKDAFNSTVVELEAHPVPKSTIFVVVSSNLSHEGSQSMKLKKPRTSPNSYLQSASDKEEWSHEVHLREQKRCQNGWQ